MQPKDGKPYLWVTWITKYLAGETQCEYYPWVKAHFWTKKRTTSFDKAKWTDEHSTMVRARAAYWTAEGRKVSLEDENAVKLEANTAIVAGKPDIIAVQHNGATIIEMLISDTKTGDQKLSDWWQMLLYLYIYSRLCPGMPLRGELVYTDAVLSVTFEELTMERLKKIAEVVRRFAGDTQLKTTPSAGECSRCDLFGCGDRIEPKEAKVATTTDF